MDCRNSGYQKRKEWNDGMVGKNKVFVFIALNPSFQYSIIPDLIDDLTL
jgi:hypothetical protein